MILCLSGHYPAISRVVGVSGWRAVASLRRVCRETREWTKLHACNVLRFLDKDHVLSHWGEFTSEFRSMLPQPTWYPMKSRVEEEMGLFFALRKIAEYEGGPSPDVILDYIGRHHNHKRMRSRLKSMATASVKPITVYEQVFCNVIVGNDANSVFRQLACDALDETAPMVVLKNSIGVGSDLDVRHSSRQTRKWRRRRHRQHRRRRPT